MLAYTKDRGYAWLIVLQGFIGSSLSDGGVFAFGIFLPLYVESLNSSTFSVALIGSLAFAVSLALSPLTGWLTDTYGPRKVLFVSAILSSLGFYTASLSTTLWQLLLSQGLLVGLGASGAYVASQAAIGYWFNERRGLAMGLSGSGTGFGSLFFLLIVNALLLNGLQYTLQVIALFELIGLLLASCLASRFDEPGSQSISKNSTSAPTIVAKTRNVSINQPPEDVEEDDDDNDDAEDNNFSRTRLDVATSQRISKSLWRSKKFVYLLLAFGVLSFGDCVPMTFLPFYAQSLGISIALSNDLVAFLGIGSGVGRILIGFFADKCSKLWLLLVTLSICSILTLGWLGYDNYSALVCYAFFFGLFFGAFNVLVGPISLELFGPEEVSNIK